MKIQVDISVIIVSWNARDYLQKCLQSVKGEIRDFNSEIIVVDNYSTDGSRELVSEYFPFVKLLSNPKNLGFAKANNIGIAESAGKYLALINSDVEVREGCFARMFKFMEEQEDVGMLGPKIVGVDGKMQRSCMRFPTLWNNLVRALALDRIFKNSNLMESYLNYQTDEHSAHPVDVINGCFWMIRRRALNEVGMLDEDFFMYGEDIDWCRRFWNCSWKVVVLPDAEALHYGGRSSSNSPIRFYLEMHRANLQYWNKYAGRASRYIYVIISCLNLFLRIIAYSFIYSLSFQKRESIAFKIKRSCHCLAWYLGLKKIETVQANNGLSGN